MASERGRYKKPHLTPREKQILELLARGLSNQAIGMQLVISALTVRDYVSRLLHKFEVRNRTELAARWKEMEYRWEAH